MWIVTHRVNTLKSSLSYNNFETESEALSFVESVSKRPEVFEVSIFKHQKTWNKVSLWKKSNSTKLVPEISAAE